MLRAIVIDDEQKGINSIKLLIEKYIKDVKVVAETTEALRGINLVEDYKPDIVFLDIKMPHLDGFEFLKKLQFRDFSLVFTTAHQEFGLQAIKNNALDYLLKPVDIEDLENAVNKVRKRIKNKEVAPDMQKLFDELRQSEHQKILFHTKDKAEYLSKSNLIRLEANSNYTKIFALDNVKLMVSKTLGDYETLLCSKDSHFMRVHQSHILNLNHVTKYLKDSGTIITKDNYSVPLSKNKREDFVRWLNIK